MGFERVTGTPYLTWVPIRYGENAYVGGIVSWDEVAYRDHNGLQMLPQALGEYNAQGHNIPFGVIIGTNLRTPVYHRDSRTEYIASASPHDSTTNYVLTGGAYPKNAREPMVKVDTIDPSSAFKAPLLNNDIDSYVEVKRVTAGSTSGVSCTTTAFTRASIESYSTIYFRSGHNEGTYRVNNHKASSTMFSWDIPTYKDVAADDDIVMVNIKMIGLSRAQILYEYASAFDVGADVKNDYFPIDVLQLDLSTAERESVIFRWNPMNWVHGGGRVDQARLDSME